MNKWTSAYELQRFFKEHPLSSEPPLYRPDVIPQDEFLIQSTEKPLSLKGALAFFACFLGTLTWGGWLSYHSFAPQLKKESLSLKAVPLDAPSPFVSFLGEAEDLRRGGEKDLFGWGGMIEVSKAASELDKYLKNCRQYRKNPDDAFRFDVKVDVKKSRFVVAGILQGMDKNEEMAACLRDRINDSRLARLRRLKEAPVDSYILKLEVRSNLGLSMPETQLSRD